MDVTNIYGFNLLLIIWNTLLAIGVALSMGKIHEIIHALRAKQLGYKVVEFKLWKNEVDIRDKNGNDPVGIDAKKIKYAPYYVLIPVGIIFIILSIIGIAQEFTLATLVIGIFLLFWHLLTFKFEGKDDK